MAKTKTSKQTQDYKGTPTFPEGLFQLLTIKFQELLGPSKELGRQRDILLFSMIHVLSACFPNVFGFYFGKKLSCNLYGIVGGPPASGKSAILLPKILGDRIHNAYFESYTKKQNEYATKLAEWNETKEGQKPEKPTLELFFIPGNSSTAGLQQLLSILKRGIMVETEVDTINLISEQKYGNYSDILRKAFHHEPISYFRKTGAEYALIENVCLSFLFTGTPEQLTGLMKSIENGLFSRVCFYVYDSQPKFSNPFLAEYQSNVLQFEEYAKEIEQIHFELLAGPEKEFRLTEEQKKIFNEKFPSAVDDFYEMTGNEGVSIIMRLGIILFRIAMILTVVRNREGDVLMCDDNDFDAANLIVDVLTAHSLAVYSTLPSEDEATGAMVLASDVLKLLPDQFETKKLIVAMARDKGISRRGTFRILNQLCNEGLLKKIKLGTYQKTYNNNKS